jgi:hypothetical protein
LAISRVRVPKKKKKALTRPLGDLSRKRERSVLLDRALPDLCRKRER